MVTIKICGLTRPEDAAHAAEAGADAIGAVVLAPKSPRDQTPQAAREVLDAAPEGVTRTLVTPTQDLVAIRDAAEIMRPDVLQLHGRWDKYTAHAVRHATGCDIAIALDIGRGQASDEGRAKVAAGYADLLLVDAHTEDGYGGQGETVDWDAAASLRAYLEELPEPMDLMLAGGLTPDNVADAVRTVAPWGVDVSSGVERAPGVKDPAAITNFINNARTAAQETRP